MTGIGHRHIAPVACRHPRRTVHGHAIGALDAHCESQTGQHSHQQSEPREMSSRGKPGAGRARHATKITAAAVGFVQHRPVGALVRPGADVRRVDAGRHRVTGTAAVPAVSGG
jgi:hypothetical protein